MIDVIDGALRDTLSETSIDRCIALFDRATQAAHNESSALFHIGMAVYRKAQLFHKQELTQDIVIGQDAPPKDEKEAEEIRSKRESVRAEIKSLQNENKQAIGRGEQPKEIDLAEGSKKLYNKAFNLFERSAENGSIAALVMLGNMLLQPDVMEQTAENVAKAVEYFEKASKFNHCDALYNLGMIYYEGKPPALKKDPQNAIKYFIKASNLGDKSAMFWLGHAYRVGDTVEMDVKKGVELIEEAANAGHSGALMYLASMYIFGEPDSKIEPNSQKGMHYLNLAVQQDSGDAHFLMGNCHFFGYGGLEVNFVKALRMYVRGGELGHAESVCCAGTLYFQGKGCEVDYEKAFHLYQLATEMGSTSALRNLASMYAHGFGVEKSKETAEYLMNFYEKAVAAKSPQSK